MKVIDGHHHLWDLNAVHYPWLMERAPRFFGDPAAIQRDFLLPELRGGFERLGGCGSVHIQVGAEDPLAEARWIDQVAAASPDWPMVQVAFADLTAPDYAAHLEALCALPSLRGVRQIVGRAEGEDAQTGTNDLITNPAFQTHLAELGARGLSFDLQLTPKLMPAMADLLARCPQTPVALCHAGSPQSRDPAHLRDWAAGMARLAACPNVTCKLSGLGMFDHQWSIESMRPVVETVLDLFGPERVMFGSNFPVDALYSDYGTLMAAYAMLIPEAMQADVFFDTANRFYRMGL